MAMQIQISQRENKIYLRSQQTTWLELSKHALVWCNIPLFQHGLFTTSAHKCGEIICSPARSMQLNNIFGLISVVNN